jgi:8-oxo-dGTP diphosphatase
MEIFNDKNDGTVRFSLLSHSFLKQADHVLVICRFYGQWLLTKHKKRGWEFPGGKREMGETLEEAATREVEEETGAQLKTLHFIGEYEVTKEERSFVKAIFYADIDTLTAKENYLETNGPVLIGGDLLTQRFEDSFSFIMKDQVVEKAIERIFDLVAGERNSNE